MFLFSSARLGPLLLAFDLLHLGSSSFAQGINRTDAFPSTLDYTQSDLALFVRSMCRMALTLPAIGTSCFESILFVLDFAITGPSTSIHSVACLDLPLFALDISNLELSLFLRSFGRFELLTSVFRESSPEVSISALDFLHLGFLLSTHSHAHLGFSAPVLRVIRFSSSLSPRSFSCSEPNLSVCGLA